LAPAGHAQPKSLQARQHFCDEVRQLYEIVDKVERQTVEARGVQPGEIAHNRIRIPNRTISPACQDAPLYLVCAVAPQQALRVGARAGVACVQVGQMPDGSPVSVIHDVLDVVIGFLLGGAADNANRRPNLDLATVFTRQALGLRNTRTTGFGRVDTIKVHI
jgi:hypothetical protein